MVASNKPTNDPPAIPLGEPAPDDFRGGFWRSVVKRLFLAIRPQFLTGAIIPVIVGSAIGYREQGALEVTIFIITLIGALCALGAGNVWNDIADDISGDDVVNQDYIFPYTGGSRFIQNGIITRRQMVIWGTTLFVIAALLGGILIMRTGPELFYFVAVGALLTGIYFGLARPVIYEFSVWAGFGPLHVTTAAYLQTGVWSWNAFLISLPIGFWILNVLLVAELPDARADALTGKKTLVTVLDIRGVRLIYLASNSLALASIFTLVIVGLIPVWSISVPLILWIISIGAVFGIQEQDQNYGTLRRTIVATLLIHLIGGLWLAVIILWPYIMQR